jgi:hypothetical protein
LIYCEAEGSLVGEARYLKSRKWQQISAAYFSEKESHATRPIREGRSGWTCLLTSKENSPSVAAPTQTATFLAENKAIFQLITDPTTPLFSFDGSSLCFLASWNITTCRYGIARPRVPHSISRSGICARDQKAHSHGFDRSEVQKCAYFATEPAVNCTLDVGAIRCPKYSNANTDIVPV